MEEAQPLRLRQLKAAITQASRAMTKESSEAKSLIDAQAGPALRMCRWLLAVSRVVLTAREALLPRDGWKVIVTALLMKAIGGVRGAYTLAAAAEEREVSILVRSALEAYITAAFIAKADSERRAERWAQYDIILKARVLRGNPELGSTPERRAAGERIVEQAQNLQEHFPSQSFWASGFGKGSVRDLFDDVKLLWYYDFVGWMSSQSTHASSVAVANYPKETKDHRPIYVVSLSGKGVHDELQVCCDLLIRSLGLLNKICALNLDSLLVDLEREHSVAFAATSGSDDWRMF